MVADCLLWEELDVARVVSASSGRWPRPRRSRGSTTTSRAAATCEAILAERPAKSPLGRTETEGIAEDPAVARRLGFIGPQRRTSRTTSVAARIAVTVAQPNSATLIEICAILSTRSGFSGADDLGDLDEAFGAVREHEYREPSEVQHEPQRYARHRAIGAHEIDT